MTEPDGYVPMAPGQLSFAVDTGSPYMDIQPGKRASKISDGRSLRGVSHLLGACVGFVLDYVFCVLFKIDRQARGVATATVVFDMPVRSDFTGC